MMSGELTDDLGDSRSLTSDIPPAATDEEAPPPASAPAAQRTSDGSICILPGVPADITVETERHPDLVEYLSRILLPRGGTARGFQHTFKNFAIAISAVEELQRSINEVANFGDRWPGISPRQVRDVREALGVAHGGLVGCADAARINMSQLHGVPEDGQATTYRDGEQVRSAPTTPVYDDKAVEEVGDD